MLKDTAIVVAIVARSGRTLKDTVVVVVARSGLTLKDTVVAVTTTHHDGFIRRFHPYQGHDFN